MKGKSLILIGMPGAGKSTVGVLLAKELAVGYVDTDILLQEQLGCSLQDYLEIHGYLALRQREQEALTGNDFNRHVVSTGGSAVYSKEGMDSLKKNGVIVYLKISEQTLLERVDNQDTRGIASAPGSTLEQVYQERLPLYERYAQLSVVCDNRSPFSIVREISRKLA